jgi:predicted AlkP superfamily phosphohydrolase/phosphomutase
VNQRLIVLALDGVTFDLIEPWVAQGLLPNLAKLIKSGAYGRMASTIPPITGAAWSTFQTGLNPGKHSVFDWLVRQPQSYHLTPVSSHSIAHTLLWEYLSTQGKRVGVIGVPVSYPARPINGFMLTDLLTPEGENYAHPSGLKREIEKKLGPYPVMPDHWRGRHAAMRWVDGLRSSLAQRIKTALYLAETNPWDFLMVHMMETDSVQHQMWHILDGETRAAYRTYGVSGNPILEIYQQADRAVGEFVSRFTDATLFVISDHGFGPLHYNIHLNCWLLNQGYLKLKKNPATLLKRLGYELGLTAFNINHFAEESKLLERGAKLRHIEVHELFGRYFLSMQNIDWSKTRAYSYGNVGQIFLNLKGREPLGIVEKPDVESILHTLIEDLKNLKNPLNGEKAIAAVYRKEEIYHGDRLDQSAELILAPADKYMAIGTSEFLANRAVTPAYAGSGWHRPEGVFIAAGESVQRGLLKGLAIVDMFPNILCAMGLPLRSDLDGDIHPGLFANAYLNQYETLQKSKIKIEASDAQLAREGLVTGYDQQIRKRLKGMGYI